MKILRPPATAYFLDPHGAWCPLQAGLWIRQRLASRSPSWAHSARIKNDDPLQK